MARPRKSGLDYFPFDVDFFNDEKMVCIAGEFGAKGELVAVKLLCAVYRNGYFSEWNDAIRFKMMRDMPGVTSDLLQQIVTRLVFWGFFDKSLFDSAGVLTSRSIQQSYFEAVRRRIPKQHADLPHLLVNVDNNAVSADNNSINVVRNATNKSKEKEIKKNKPPLTPPAGENHARHGAESGEDFLKIFFERTESAELERRLAAMEITRDRFEHIAELVVSEWKADGVSHNSYGAAARHLWNHVRKKLSATPSLRTCRTRRQVEQDRAERQRQRQARDVQEQSYQQSVNATGMTGWQRWCASRGLDPEKTSAADIAPTA